jgi:hypothetical protein
MDYMIFHFQACEVHAQYLLPIFIIRALEHFDPCGPSDDGRVQRSVPVGAKEHEDAA